MNTWSSLRSLAPHQWRAFLAAYLGWTLDAFDYFVLVMVVRHVAADFHTQIAAVSYALFLTLAMRPLGALLFGLAADRRGRRFALTASILFYTGMELFSAFAPSLGWLLLLRALFGVGMGGEWGVGASLAMESVPAESRGLLSGVLQQGYPVGYLLAALAYKFVFPHFGWRGMFVAGVLPAVTVFFIRLGVRESPVWLEQRRQKALAAGAGGAEGRAFRLRAAEIRRALASRGPLLLYLVALMAAFNFFSHGSQDLYPSAFLEKQRGLPNGTVGSIVIVYNLGALTGGMFFGALSQRLGRRRAITLASLLVLPALPFWIGPSSAAALAAGSFLMQFVIQGAWGVVPAHLNELSPKTLRGTIPGLTYQLGNLLASGCAPLQAAIAARHGGNYALPLGWVVGIFAVVLAGLAWFGPEATGSRLSA